MKIKTGNMWSVEKEADLFLFTSNGVLNRGMLVMGGGFAKQMLDHVSTSLPKALGSAIKRRDYPHNGNVYNYGLLVSDNWPVIKWGAFQTKLHYRDETPLNLVNRSAELLDRWAHHHPDAQIHCNFPGIGLGGRTYREILPIIDDLADNIHFWTLDNWRDRPHYKGMPQEFYRKVEEICGDKDPDNVLSYNKPKYQGPEFEWWHETYWKFGYIFDVDGEILTMAHAGAYFGDPFEDFVVWTTRDEQLFVSRTYGNTWRIFRTLPGKAWIEVTDKVDRDTAERMFPYMAGRERSYKYGVQE